MNTYERAYKICVLGKSGVGKSSLIKTLNSNVKFDYLFDYNCEISLMVHDVNDVPIYIPCFSMMSGDVLDTNNIALKFFFKNASLIILMINLDEQESLEVLNEWVIELLKFKGEFMEYHHVILIGNQRGDFNSPKEEEGAYRSKLAKEFADKISSDIDEPVRYYDLEVINFKHVSKLKDWIYTDITQNYDKLYRTSDRERGGLQ